MADLASVLADAENPAYVRSASAKILLRQDLTRRLAELQAEFEAAVSDTAMAQTDEGRRVAKEITALKAEIDEAKVEFRFHNIGRRAWADLLLKHPPTKEQARTLKVDHNPETFPIAAIAASCVEPEGMDEAAVKRLEAALTDSQFTALWAAAVEANIGGDAPKADLLSGLIARLSGQSGTTAVSEESPEASS